MSENRLLLVDDILDRTFEVPSDVLFEQVKSETVLLQFSSGDYYGLNAVGSRIWELVADGVSVRQVLKSLVAEFEVGEERLRQDLTEFLRDLVGRGLIQVAREHG